LYNITINSNNLVIVKAVITFGYNLGITDFVSDCAIESSASGKVLEKCGMYIDHKSSFKQPKTNIVYESYVYKLHEASPDTCMS